MPCMYVILCTIMELEEGNRVAHVIVGGLGGGGGYVLVLCVLEDDPFTGVQLW